MGDPAGGWGPHCLPVLLVFDAHALSPALATAGSGVTARYPAGTWKPGDLSQRDRQNSHATKEGRKHCAL